MPAAFSLAPRLSLYFLGERPSNYFGFDIILQIVCKLTQALRDLSQLKDALFGSWASHHWCSLSENFVASFVSGDYRKKKAMAS